jgi:hypothetical protein
MDASFDPWIDFRFVRFFREGASIVSSLFFSFVQLILAQAAEPSFRRGHVRLDLNRYVRSGARGTRS